MREITKKDKSLVEYFIKDGVIDKKKWDAQEVKILFLLKEVNGDIGPDLIWWLKGNKGLFGRTYPVVIGWAKTIWEYLCRENISEEEMIDRIAVVNLKKTVGGARTNRKELKAFLRKNKELLKTQIESINPNIIVCGNVGELYFDVYDEQISKMERFTAVEREIPPLSMYLHCERVIFNAYHPSAWKYKTTNEDFIELLKKENERINKIVKRWNG